MSEEAIKNIVIGATENQYGQNSSNSQEITADFIKNNYPQVYEQIKNEGYKEALKKSYSQNSRKEAVSKAIKEANDKENSIASKGPLSQLSGDYTF